MLHFLTNSICIQGITEAFKADASSQKINLGTSAVSIQHDSLDWPSSLLPDRS